MYKLLYNFPVLRNTYARAKHYWIFRNKRTYLDAEELYFGQQHAGTIGFLGPEYWTIPMVEFPQVKYLQGDTEYYRQYLRNSFSVTRVGKNIDEEVENQVRKFEKLKTQLERAECREPVQFTTRLDGKKIILDGNHRAAILALQNKKIPAIEIPLYQFLTRKVIQNKEETFGTRKQGLPYQSLFLNEKEILTGRRRDILDRMKLMYRGDLENKTVLDMGCNIGSSTLLAKQFGATDVVGVDVSPKIITTAIRLNVALFCLPCKFTYKSFAEVTNIGTFDTGFVFSLDAHVKNDAVLAQNIKQNIKSVVYFECHRGHDMPEQIRSIFSKIDFIGYTDTLRRKFYRCQL